MLSYFSYHDFSYFRFLISMLHWIFHCPNMSGSCISFWILTVPCILGSKGCLLKLLERIQLNKPLLIVKSPKFSLVNGSWNNVFTLWPSSILNFHWLELFCLIHSVSHSSLLDICLNAIHCLSKSIFQTVCDSLIIAFAFPSSLEKAGRCWNVLYHVYCHLFSHTFNPSSYIHIWVYMPCFLWFFFCTLYDQVKNIISIHTTEFALESISAVKNVTFLVRNLHLSLSIWV